jgi:WD40 repeat protein
MPVTRTWQGSELKRFHAALLSAFPDRAGIEEVVRFGLNAQLNSIVSESNQRAAIFKLLEWAEAQGRLEDLLKRARECNSGNPALRALADAIDDEDAPAPFLVPAQSPDFVGRERDLERVHEVLRAERAGRHRWVALVGMGGIGKSKLAVAYAYAYRDAYPGGVYWLDAAAPLLTELASIVGLREESASERRALRLRRDADALLIFDNAADPLALRRSMEGIVRPPLDCRMLFTTRRAELDRLLFETIHVDRLPDDAARRLLLADEGRQAALGGAPAAEQKAATEICVALGNLPLAIVLAARYLAKFRRLSLVSYLARLRREGALATTDGVSVPPGSTSSAEAPTAALRPQWDALQNANARHVLKTAALFREAARVSRATLALFSGLSDEAMDGYPAPLDEALRELTEWSLVEEHDEATIRLHPLVREFAEAQIDQREAFAEACSVRLVDALGRMDRLAAEVASRGLDAVLADLRFGEQLGSAGTRNRLRQLLRPLDREAHCLRRWDPKNAPAFFLQQLRNMSFELGMDETQKHAEAALTALGVPWLRERIRTSRESEALVRTLAGHTSSVRALVVTRDGRLVISGSDDGALKVWELSSGCELRTLTGSASPLSGVAVTADGVFVVSASEDGAVDTWEVSSGRHVASRIGGANQVNTVLITEDDQRIITASADGTLMESDLEREELRVLRLTGHVLDLNGVACSRDGGLAISASNDKTLKVWELPSGRLLRTLEGHTWDVTGVATAPNADVVVSASKDKTLKVWELESGVLLRTLQGHTRDVTRVAVTPDGRLAVSASDDDTLRVWEIESGRELQTLEGHAEVNDVAVTPEGRWAVSASKDGTLKVWELSSSAQLRRISGHDGDVTGVAVTPDGRVAVSASGDGTLKVWDLLNGMEVRTLEGHAARVTAVAVAHDSCLAASASVDSTLKLWDLRTGRELRTLRGHTWSVASVALTADGRRLMSASGDKTLKVWDLSTGLEMRVLDGHTASVTGVTVTSDARWAISASDDTTLRLWDVSNEYASETLVGHINTVTCVAVTPDGRHAVSASEDTTVKVWDLRTRREVRTLRGHTQLVNGVAVTPDGRLIVSTSEDATLKVWELESGRLFANLEAHAPLLCCTVTPDGRTFLAGDSAGSLHVVDWVAGTSRRNERPRVPA